MQTIITHWLPPTNFRGSRIKARTSSGVYVIVPWDHALNIERNHNAAARALCRKLGWSGEWVRGWDEKAGYVFVNIAGERMSVEDET